MNDVTIKNEEFVWVVDPQEEMMDTQIRALCFCILFADRDHFCGIDF